MDQRINPTEVAHQELQRAFDALNVQLFDGELPPCMITLQRGRATRGYFAAHRFIRSDATTTHEIAINPQIFALATLPEVLSELAHNMCHLYAHVHGQAGRRGYHSKGWAAQMEAIGLMPSTTGLPGGKTTGEKVEHYIIEGGRFAEVAEAMVRDGFNITWLDRVVAPWREGQEPSTERGHLLGEALLGMTGLLVDSATAEEPDLGDQPFGAPEDGSNETVETPSRPDDGASDGSAMHAGAGFGADPEEHDPWDYPRGASETSFVDPDGASGAGDDSHSAQGAAPPVVLDTGARARGEEPSRPVPLLVRAGEDLSGRKAKKRRDKVTFQCPKCAQKAWAKGTATLDCGKCKVALVASDDPGTGGGEA